MASLTRRCSQRQLVLSCRPWPLRSTSSLRSQRQPAAMEAVAQRAAESLRAAVAAAAASSVSPPLVPAVPATLVAAAVAMRCSAGAAPPAVAMEAASRVCRHGALPVQAAPRRRAPCCGVKPRCRKCGRVAGIWLPLFPRRTLTPLPGLQSCPHPPALLTRMRVLVFEAPSCLHLQSVSAAVAEEPPRRLPTRQARRASIRRELQAFVQAKRRQLGARRRRRRPLSSTTSAAWLPLP